MSEFASTHWSVVLAAGRQGRPEGARALAELCQKYWQPVYVYVRRSGADRHDAQDLTQGFFARLLEKNDLSVADPERGRFRTFLLTAVKNYLANEWDKKQAQKRGGGRTVLALDWEDAESRVNLEPAHELTAERIFERQWAVLLLERVLTKLRADYQGSGKNRHFDLLKGTLTCESAQSLAEIGAALGLSEGAAKVAAHRFRNRYREVLRAEVGETLGPDEDVDTEIRRLFETL